MVYVNSKKFACESCIKGHRSSSCHHTDRPLFEIKKKGRPVSQCEKCRELRQSKKIHSKCTCNPKPDSANRGEVLASTTSKSRRFIPIVPALPNGLRDVFAAAQVPSPLPDARQRVDALLNPCPCKSVWKCNCQQALLSTDKSNSESSGDLAILAHAATMSCCNTSVNPTNPSDSSKHSNAQSSSLHQDSHERSKCHDNHQCNTSPVLELPPIQTSNELSPILPNQVPDFGFMPPISTITSLAGSGCTCGVKCSCPGCVEHRGSAYAAKELHDCTEGQCGTCVDSQSGITLPISTSPFSSIPPTSASSAPSLDFINKSASLNRFFARAATLPPPPARRRVGSGVQFDPRDVGSSFVNAQPVNLPKLECCSGSCSCANGQCRCGASCGGCCPDMEVPAESHASFGLAPTNSPAGDTCSSRSVSITVDVAATPLRNCCTGKDS
ncbi:copper-binding transcription factor [Leucoagaricus gongylophorus]